MCMGGWVWCTNFCEAHGRPGSLVERSCALGFRSRFGSSGALKVLSPRCTRFRAYITLKRACRVGHVFVSLRIVRVSLAVSSVVALAPGAFPGVFSSHRSLISSRSVSPVYVSRLTFMSHFHSGCSTRCAPRIRASRSAIRARSPMRHQPAARPLTRVARAHGHPFRPLPSRLPRPQTFAPDASTQSDRSYRINICCVGSSRRRST